MLVDVRDVFWVGWLIFRDVERGLGREEEIVGIHVFLSSRLALAEYFDLFICSMDSNKSLNY